MPSSSRRSFFYVTGLAASCLLGFFLGRSYDGNFARPRVGEVASAVPSAGQSVGATQSRRPLIGISSLTDDHYVRAVRESGGIPVVLPNTDGSVNRVDEYIALLDGLLMPGGADIPPAEYGEE
ncbi:MAG: gamma-glutamyl-gamma-aminobutyrate hydrolase family protein, partial [Planctomycetales bacterium]|nr:gamma-glutamyl-gamma-aminobutyrate hydrolase family protein [Planctomycetales bacterium]